MDGTATSPAAAMAPIAARRSILFKEVVARYKTRKRKRRLKYENVSVGRKIKIASPWIVTRGHIQWDK
jgi:hypothetical protein